MTAAVDRVVAAIGGMALEDLREEWRRRYGAPPRLRSVPIMRQLLAWRVQPPPDPDFRHKVWQRIGGPSTATWLPCTPT